MSGTPTEAPFDQLVDTRLLREAQAELLCSQGWIAGWNRRRERRAGAWWSVAPRSRGHF
jgi:hypothetical protein